MSSANAEEAVVNQQLNDQPTPPLVSDPQPNVAPTLNEIQTKVDDASSIVETAVQNAETAVQTILPSPDIAQTISVMPAVVDAVDLATTKLNEANTAIQTAETALVDAVAAKNNVTEQLVVVENAETAVDEAQDALDQADAAVEAQEAIVTQENNELTAIQNTPLGSMVYTTAGYEAPVAPENPTVTTTVLPQMGDASTKITVPFDIKMGDTVFEGQGSASQIYVSSKAIISFGGPDYTYWGWPNMTQDGIYVFNSDYTSFGTGAGITVTTTETTLSIDWNVHKWGDLNGPLTNISWDMTVNPTTGEWTGAGSMSGSTVVWNGPNTGVRQDNVLTQITTYTQSNKNAAILAQQAVISTQDVILDSLIEVQTEAEEALDLAQTTLTAENLTLSNLQSLSVTAINTANQLASAAVVKANEAKTALESATATVSIAVSQYVAEQLRLQALQNALHGDPGIDSPTQTPTDPDTEESSQTTDPSPEDTDNTGTDETDAVDPETDTSTDQEQTTTEQEQESQNEESSQETTTPEEDVVNAVEDAQADGVVTEAEKEAIADALIEAADGEAVTAEAIAEAGLEYKDLPPETPVEVRTDENGNQVIITADVAAALVLLENPAELIGAIFSDPGEALQALGNIGADMSPQEREEAQKMVVAAVIAGNAAINAVAVAGAAAGGPASGGSQSGGSGGGNSGGGGASGESKGYRRRRP